MSGPVDLILEVDGHRHTIRCPEADAYRMISVMAAGPVGIKAYLQDASDPHQPWQKAYRGYSSAVPGLDL